MFTTDNPKSQPPALKFYDSVTTEFSPNLCIINMLVFCTKTVCCVFTFRAYYGIQRSSIHLVHIIFQPGSILTTNFSLKQNKTEKSVSFKKMNLFFFSHQINRRPVECLLLTLSWQACIIHLEELFFKSNNITALLSEWQFQRLSND